MWKFILKDKCGKEINEVDCSGKAFKQKAFASEARRRTVIPILVV